MGKTDFYWYWLCNIPGIGGEKIRRLLAVCESAEDIYKLDQNIMMELNVLSESDIQRIQDSKKDTDLYQEYIELQKKNIQFISCKDPLYPERLMELSDYPVALYCKGRMPDPKVPSIAIVGARACTEYGRSCAYELARRFAGMGLQVISGMALGIDAASHKGALSGRGYTCAVLGCGVDICYPRENIELYTQMMNSGGILSEYVPGTPPHAGQFPVRNRIISGIADVVIVIEARKKSGSLITVDQALDQNRDIMVVPGRVNDRLSEGCNNLIKMGAQMITVPEDVLSNSRIQEYIHDKDLCDKEVCRKNISEEDINMEYEIKVFDCIDSEPVSLDQLMQKTQLTFGQLGTILLQLQLKGKITEIAKNCYAKTHIFP